MKSKKLRFVTLFITFVLLLINVCVYAKTDIPAATNRFFINDYANVIDDETENYIFEKGKEYNGNGGPQVVVLTMDTINNESVEDFAIETARKWGIGSKDESNGVLILLVMDSRDIRIEVGYGLEGVLNDGKCGRFIRNATDMLSNGDYSGGIKQIYDDVIGEMENPSEEDENQGMYDIIFAALLVVVSIVVGIIMYKYNSRNGGKGDGSGDGGGYYRRGGYYGGFGSGGSFGGGSGGFSGGGGSFGGGGSSGKF